MKSFPRNKIEESDMEQINSCEGMYDWKKHVIGHSFNNITNRRKTPIYRNCSERNSDRQEQAKETVVGYNCSKKHCSRHLHLDKTKSPMPPGLSPSKSSRKNQNRHARQKAEKVAKEMAPNLNSMEEFPELHERCLCNQKQPLQNKK